MNKILFGISIVYTLGLACSICYLIYNKHIDLAVIFGLTLGASILNCGNFYGYIKNEERKGMSNVN